MGNAFDQLEMGDDQPGELLLKGPFQMKGYINNKKANDETFTSDGWMRTGDVAKFDSKTQEFYIVDRIKELIKYKGLQVAPAGKPYIHEGTKKGVQLTCLLELFRTGIFTDGP